MIELKANFTDETHKVLAATDKGEFKTLEHAAASIAKDTRESIERASGASPPGTPPHTHGGLLLKKAIRYAVYKGGAVIGAMASVVGQSANPHEFGGVYKGRHYPKRSFELPALLRGAPRFGGEFKGSIGQ